MLLLKMFQRRWLVPSLLVLIGTALCVRLGIWQLDRLEQRRAFNTRVQAARSQPVLDLNRFQPEDIARMEWRAVEATGTYDFTNQVAVRNQYHGSEYGYHLLTPLRLNGIAIFVDRGWIPAEGNDRPSDWRKYDVNGDVSVSGQLRLGQSKPELGGVPDPSTRPGEVLEIWNNADIDRISAQMPYPVLPVYIQPEVVPGDTEPPIPFQPVVELTEGPHFGYAIQWFTFATILFVGYPFYLSRQESLSE